MFGIDINNLQNTVNGGTFGQPTNQYQTSSNATNPNQTSWMQPVSNSDSTLRQAPSISGPSQPPSGNTGVSGYGTGNPGSSGQIPQGDGTALSAIGQGWRTGNNSLSWYADDQNYGKMFPGDNSGQQQQNQNAPTYGSFTQVGGFDQGKLNDPNKHDPKYDWERARQIAGGGGDLSGAINYYNSHLANGEQPARWMGGDKVDFGAGVGPVDVLIGSKAGINQDWWNPLTGDSSNPSGQPNSNFGGTPTPDQQQYNPSMTQSRQAMFRKMDPYMQNRLSQINPAVRQMYGQPIYNNMPVNPPSGGNVVPGMNPNNSILTAPIVGRGYNDPTFNAQPDPRMMQVLNQMWSGTYRPPNYGMPQ